MRSSAVRAKSKADPGQVGRNLKIEITKLTKDVIKFTMNNIDQVNTYLLHS